MSLRLSSRNGGRNLIGGAPVLRFRQFSRRPGSQAAGFFGSAAALHIELHQIRSLRTISSRLTTPKAHVGVEQDLPLRGIDGQPLDVLAVLAGDVEMHAREAAEPVGDVLA